MTIPYNLNVPDGNEKPSISQPKMLQNTNSISAIIDVDHVGFNASGGGRHKQVNFAQNLAGDPTVNGSGTLYTKDPLSNLFYKSISGVVTQLTGASLQSNGTNYGIRLSEGIIVNWGFYVGGSTTPYEITIGFAIPLTNTSASSLILSKIPGGGNDNAIKGVFINNSQFNAQISSGGNFYYFIIGV